MFKGAYEGRRVLITGHTGFVGSWMTLWLLEQGADVMGVSRGMISDPSAFSILHSGFHKSNFTSLTKHDILDGAGLKLLFSKWEPEIVFHLAAQAIVAKSYEFPVLTMQANTIGTTNVLEAIRKTPSVKAGVMVTTDKVYKNSEWCWGYRENDELGGDDPYSASKAGAELIAKAYNLSYFKNGPPYVATARAGNVIGGGDWGANRLIPDCVRAWSEGKKVKIRNPQSTRPWQHILDLVSGYLILGSYLLDGKYGGESFNFGPSTVKEYSVLEVVEEMIKHWPDAAWESGSDIDSKEWKEHDAKWESNLLKLNVDKAWKYLNWKSILPFDLRVEWTTKWYKEFYENPNSVPLLSIEQIEEYEKLWKVLKK